MLLSTTHYFLAFICIFYQQNAYILIWNEISFWREKKKSLKQQHSQEIGKQSNKQKINKKNASVQLYLTSLFSKVHCLAKVMHEYCVMNLSVITTFMSLWGLLSPLIHLFIPASCSLHNSDLCTMSAPTAGQGCYTPNNMHWEAANIGRIGFYMQE